MGHASSLNTVAKLLHDAGEVCADFHNETVRGVQAKRVAESSPQALGKLLGLDKNTWRQIGRAARANLDGESKVCYEMATE